MIRCANFYIFYIPNVRANYFVLSLVPITVNSPLSSIFPILYHETAFMS